MILASPDVEEITGEAGTKAQTHAQRGCQSGDQRTLGAPKDENLPVLQRQRENSKRG